MLMDTLGVAVCYALAAGVILGCVAFVVEARREMRNLRGKEEN